MCLLWFYMLAEQAKIINNYNIKGKYYRVDFMCEKVSGFVKPGQFVHVQIKNMGDRLFRRPFSVFNVPDDGILSIVYKVVGYGTNVLSELKNGEICNILGPLGNSYSIPKDNETPIIIAGGYGAASIYLLAKNSPIKGKVLLGAKNKDALILCDEFKVLGFDVEVATDDGSYGYHGFVTDLLFPYLQNARNRIYGCGPNPMMYTVTKMLSNTSKIAELSLDENMCCGVGACFGCMIKVVANNGRGWEYKRSCKEGPIFKSNEIYIDF